MELVTDYSPHHTSPWLAPSKLLVNPREERLLGSSSPPRLPGSLLLPLGESRSLTATDLARSLLGRSEGTRNPLSSLSASFHSSVWSVKSPRTQDRPEVPELRRDGPAGGQRGLPGGTFRGHEPVRHPRQESDHHAQGHPAGQEDPRGESLVRFGRQSYPVTSVDCFPFL